VSGRHDVSLRPILSIQPSCTKYWRLTVSSGLSGFQAGAGCCQSNRSSKDRCKITKKALSSSSFTVLAEHYVRGPRRKSQSFVERAAEKAIFNAKRPRQKFLYSGRYQHPAQTQRLLLSIRLPWIGKGSTYSCTKLCRFESFGLMHQLSPPWPGYVARSDVVGVAQSAPFPRLLLSSSL
jgi:hypothetical protein